MRVFIRLSRVAFRSKTVLLLFFLIFFGFMLSAQSPNVWKYCASDNNCKLYVRYEISNGYTNVEMKIENPNQFDVYYDITNIAVTLSKKGTIELHDIISHKTFCFTPPSYGSSSKAFVRIKDYYSEGLISVVDGGDLTNFSGVFKVYSKPAGPTGGTVTH